ncbi:hypothetical protein IFDJLNFL_4324 [Methylobacterium dankookense]|uniref:Uncharacterized protein n=1 Tax=Methylobacterium dankookense TaxID=560405 RepID=A0ABQ4RMW3_9HYPH|nr:hypothetical protein IFDJLNFL_4324 [Methylobacterium dankookense]
MREAPDHDVLQDRHLPEQLGVLEGAGEAEPGDGVDLPAGEVRSVEAERTRARPVEARDRVDEGRLARSVRADQGVDLPWGDADTGRIQGGEAAEAHGEAVRLQGGGGAARQGLGGGHALGRVDPARARSQAGVELAQRAEDAAGQAEHHRQQQRAVGEFLPLGEALQHLGQVGEDEGAEHRPEGRGRAPQDHHQQEADGIREGEDVGRDVGVEEGVEAAGDPRRHRRDREGQRADAGGADAEAARRRLALGHRQHRPAVARMLQVVRGERRQEQREGEHRVEGVARERMAEQVRARDAGEPGGAPGQALPFDGDVLDDEAEGDRHHREVDAAHPHARIGERRAEQARDHRRAEAREQEVEAEPDRQDRARIGAEREQAGLAERDEPGEAHEDVQADRDHAVDQEQHEQTQLVLVAGGQRHGDEDNGEEREAEGVEGLHTLKISRRPNRP